MNDYQEYKSYGSYLSRVFAIIIAFVLLVLVIWFVVRLATDDEEATLGDSTTSEIDRGDLTINPDGEADDATDDNGEVAGETDTPGDAPTTTDDEDGETSSINTDNDPNINGDGTVAGVDTDDTLPDTGADVGLLIGLPVATFITSHAIIARRAKQ